MQRYNKKRPHMSASDKSDKNDYFIGTKTLPYPHPNVLQATLLNTSNSFSRLHAMSMHNLTETPPSCPRTSAQWMLLPLNSPCWPFPRQG